MTWRRYKWPCGQGIFSNVGDPLGSPRSGRYTEAPWVVIENGLSSSVYEQRQTRTESAVPHSLAFS
jgi:hypothetical protein